MRGVVITSRPIMPDTAPFILLQGEGSELQRILLYKNEPITIRVATENRYCMGWYDIQTHENHPCDQGRVVDPKFESCFECRNKTGFNPAFYNTETVSSVQEAYNQQPHSVYVAYFGSGLTKAGIMSDSRGLERIFEQGALFYVNMGSLANARQARDSEASLIDKGLRNSVSKKQKEDALRTQFGLEAERKQFLGALAELELDSAGEVKSNLDHFFFGQYPCDQITPVSGELISGKIMGMVGRYLVVKNGDRLFGFWLSELAGYRIDVAAELEGMDVKPTQASMF